MQPTMRGTTLISFLAVYITLCDSLRPNRWGMVRVEAKDPEECKCDLQLQCCATAVPVFFRRASRNFCRPRPGFGYACRHSATYLGECAECLDGLECRQFGDENDWRCANVGRGGMATTSPVEGERGESGPRGPEGKPDVSTKPPVVDKTEEGSGDLEEFLVV